jgi:hypothetical protein
MEHVPAANDVNLCLPSLCVFGTTGQESACDIFIYPLLIPCKISDKGGRMDGRMRFIIILAIAWGSERPVL